MHQQLLAAQFPLWGSRLIEASAGTGKTWTIAALYLRLVLGHGSNDNRFTRPLLPSEILVMTFTKAATRELSDRIRSRLLEAAQHFRSDTNIDIDVDIDVDVDPVPLLAPADDFLQELLAHYPSKAERNHAAWRLASAADGMDVASVYTIDAWCQRMLREHAFDSGSLFEEELVPDEEALLLEAGQDYWRRQCYPLAPEVLAQVLGLWKNLPSMVADVRQLLKNGAASTAQPKPPQPETLQALIAQNQQTLAPFLAGKVAYIDTICQWLEVQVTEHRNLWNGNLLRTQSVENWCAILRQWATQECPLGLPDLGTGLYRLTPGGLEEARKKSAPASSTTIQIIPVFDWFEKLVAHYQNYPVEPSLRLHAALCVQQRLIQLKQQAAQFDFNGMLERLDAALHSEQGPRLRSRILAQYPVALIDEFQDTSPLQYRIFDAIYDTKANAPEQAFLLIGDPKQSIYGFRGADIYSYLQARRATEHRHYVLGVNYRSTKALVEVVNHCFARADASSGQSGAFLFRAPDGNNPVPFVDVEAQGRPEYLRTSAGPVPAFTLAHDLNPLSVGKIHLRFANLCAEQIATWLNDPRAGFMYPDGRLAPLRPCDIAILVRTGKEAAVVRRALQQRKIASVYLSDKDSVFHSAEAQDLVHWLRGIATPQDATLVRAALAVGTIGWSLEELGQMLSDDEAFDAHSEQMRQLQRVWQTQGILAMLRQTLHRFNLAAHWLHQDGGERRLTNFLHLAELLQNASPDLEGEQAMVRWLVQQIAETAGQNDDKIVRLESDSDLVKIVTIYKSKGLEYPLVCLPFASSFRAIDRKLTKSLRLPTETGPGDLLFTLSDNDIARADLDRLREDLRLLYVAMTRPRHALWMGFAAVKNRSSNACDSHQSAAGCLWGGRKGITPDAWRLLLQALAENAPGIVLQNVAATEVGFTRLQATAPKTTLRDVPPYSADFDRDWAIASYSRLTRHLSQQPTLGKPGSALSALHRFRPADDGPSDTTVDGVKDGMPPVRHRFQKGPLAGNFLHEQLAWLAGSRFILDTPAHQARLRERCEGAGYTDDAEALVGWLQDIAQTPLAGPGVALNGIGTACIEMEFWMPVHHLDSQQVDTCVQQCFLPGAERPPLQNSVLHGMLMGFADLVFEHQGRYWVLDYKSNSLGPDDAAYPPDALDAAMLRHRYDVQAALYLLALHRLLEKRLPDYDPAQHLGGAVYLFLRAIHGTSRGVCLFQPSLALLQALDAALDSPSAQELPE